jgi:hypothetical protein
MNKSTEAQQLSNELKSKIDAILKRTDLKSSRISQILCLKNNSYRTAASHGKIRQYQYDKVVAYFKIYDDAMLEMENKLKENDIFVGY